MFSIYLVRYTFYTNCKFPEKRVTRFCSAITIVKHYSIFVYILHRISSKIVRIACLSPINRLIALQMLQNLLSYFTRILADHVNCLYTGVFLRYFVLLHIEFSDRSFRTISFIQIPIMVSASQFQL